EQAAHGGNHIPTNPILLLGYSRLRWNARARPAPGKYRPGAMTIRLTVDRARWWTHVSDLADRTAGLVPVVKGNGYGFGRIGLATIAARLSPIIAVGTVHELDGLPDG